MVNCSISSYNITFVLKHFLLRGEKSACKKRRKDKFPSNNMQKYGFKTLSVARGNCTPSKNDVKTNVSTTNVHLWNFNVSAKLKGNMFVCHIFHSEQSLTVPARGCRAVTGFRNNAAIQAKCRQCTEDGYCPNKHCYCPWQSNGVSYILLLFELWRVDSVQLTNSKNILYCTYFLTSSVM